MADHPEVVDPQHPLATRLRELCLRRGHAWVEPSPRWYGLDPVHVARAQRRAAWRAILEAWRPGAPLTAFADRRAGWPAPLRCAPQQSWLLGFERRSAQPCARVADGSTLSLY